MKVKIRDKYENKISLVKEFAELTSLGYGTFIKDNGNIVFVDEEYLKNQTYEKQREFTEIFKPFIEVLEP